MKTLRILFMGTPEFAVTVLEKIITHNFSVVGVVTAPDRPAGRGRKLKQSAVKEFAKKHGIEVFQPTNLKSEEFQQTLKKLNPTVQVVVAFRMLPEKIWKFPMYGTFNLHASLLPQYRGAAPINWAIINGEEKTGVSTFFIDEEIDTGTMILQKEVEISKLDNAGSLHDKLMHTGADLVVDTLQKIASETLTTTPQDDKGKELKTAYKLTKENTRINWQQSAGQIYNHIRGLSPYPVAWTILKNPTKKLHCKIHKADFQEVSHAYTSGSIIVENNEVRVATPDGFILIEEMQLPGKRKMDMKSLLNGFSLSTDAEMM